MKIRAYFKDHYTMLDAVDDAFAKAPKPDGISDEEWDTLKEGRAEDAKEHIAEKWMDYRWYLMVEFDTEAGTATVIPRGEQ